MPEPTSERVAPQLAILLVAAVIAAAAGAASFAGLLAAYGLAWLAVNAVVARGIALPRGARTWIAAVVVLVAAAPIVTLARRGQAIADTELLGGLDVNVRDRLALERLPAIHPAIVLADRPQLFFAHAPDAGELRVELGSFAQVEAEPLGHGLFRVDFDPARDGAPDHEGEIAIRLVADGSISERAGRAIVPPPHPRWLRVASDRARACTTSEETDDLLIVEGARVSRIPVLDGPSDCAWTGDAIAVSHRYARELAIVRDGAITERIAVGAGQARLAASEDGARIAVAREVGEVAVIERGLESGPVRRYRVGSPDWVALEGETLIVAQREPAALTWIATGSPALASARTREMRAWFHAQLPRTTIALRAPAVTMARAPAAGTIVIAATDHAPEGEDPRAHLGNHYVQDQLLAYDARSRALVRQLLTGGRSPRQDAAGGIDRGVSPMGVDEAPDGSLCVAFAGSDELAIVPVAGAIRWLDVARAGLSAPCSCALLADGSIVATSPSSGVIAILDAAGHPRTIERLAPDDATLLRDDPDALQVRYGERAFYETTRAGISCQSCHLHGGSDGLMHNIGGRTLVPTLDTRGLAGTSPYLRDGSYPRMSDLHVVADELYRGYREPAGDRGATIEAWLATLPPPLPLRPRDRERERQGLDVLVRAGCPTCHALPAFTHLGRHPTRSVFPDAPDAAPGASLDTPSLRATSRRSRWLFDGRSLGLADVLIEHSSGGRHGRVAELDDREIADLLVFLGSL